MTATTEYRDTSTTSPVRPIGNRKSAIKKGWVNCFYRRYKGKKLGPYYVRRWKVGTKLHKEYIRPQDVERVRAECQAHRERQNEKREANRKINTYIDNWSFLGRMLDKFDAGKEVYKPQADYILRLSQEGMYIKGIPPSRRRITRRYAVVDVKEVIITTVLELDGTTKTFMVPFVIRRPIDYLKELFDRFSKELFDDKPDHSHPPTNKNLWLQPQF